MSMQRTSQRGFTLVEILIVVIILGILAAIVIPQFTNASEDARKSSLVSQLQTLRSQVELYKLQHRELWPTSDGSADATKWDWTKLTGKTDEDGGANATGKCGPYLQQEPVNPLNGFSAVSDAPADSVGFVFDAATGKVFATGKTPTNYFNDATGQEGTTKPGETAAE